jgi:predicted DNA-binding transcriptional regulator YafY
VNRVDRLTGLLLTLQQGQVSAQALADRFEVSRRTILRDLDALAEIGVPLVSAPGRSGGFRVEDGYWLPPLHLSTDEAAALLFAIGLAENADGDSPLGNAHRSAREKIEGALRPNVRAAANSTIGAIQVARHHSSIDPMVTATILGSITGKQWLRMRYRSPSGESTRTMLPLSLSVSSGKWYVRSVDEHRQAIRIFRLDRITELRRTPTPSDATEIVERATREDGSYRASTNPEVLVELTEIGLALALDHLDFHRWLTPAPGGAVLRFRCPVAELPYYCRELLRFALEARVLAPEELRTMMIEHTTTVLEHHRS